METVDLGLAGCGGHRAIEVAVGNTLLVEIGAEESEEGSELCEDEEAVAVVEGFGEDFAEGVQFRGVGERGGAGVWRIGFLGGRFGLGIACQ